MTLRDHIHWNSISFFVACALLGGSIYGLIDTNEFHIENVDKVISNKTIIIDGESKQQVEIKHYQDEVRNDPFWAFMSFIGFIIGVVAFIATGVLWLFRDDCY